MWTRTNKARVLGVALTALFILGSASAARAHNDDWCYKHVRHQQHELDEAIHDHGHHSWQADRERRKLDEVRDQCRDRAYRDRDWDHDRNYNRFR